MYYIIHDRLEGTTIKYTGSLRSYLESKFPTLKVTDGIRRTFAHTRERRNYYKGLRVVAKVKDDVKYATFDEIAETMEEEWNPKRNILVIGDLHCPADYTPALQIAKSIFLKENITDVVFLGDVVDFYTVSRFPASPDFPYTQREEFIKAKEHLSKWHSAFPAAKVCWGNHSMRIKKKLFGAGVSEIWLQDFKGIFGLQGWDFKLFHEIGDFVFTHGMNQIAKSRSKDIKKSVVQGHYHSRFNAEFLDKKWAIQAGCLIDRENMAFEYGKFLKLPKLGLVVIKDIEGTPEIKMIPIKYIKKELV